MTVRGGFAGELESLRLQVEVMTIRVADAVMGARTLLESGDADLAQTLVDADDAIDDMHTSLEEQCYRLLAREAPVAADLRLVVSVIRVLHELERIGDLALRVLKSIDDIPLIAAHREVYELLLGLADNVVARFLAVQRGWSESSIEPLEALDESDPLARFADPLVNQLMALTGPDSVRVALAAMYIGRSFDRIGDHTQIMASRLQYLVTGDSAHLAEEVAW
ncbi:MAG: phosphate signaling complex PhoU family protein [Acidimicrobiales bacterium]